MGDPIRVAVTGAAGQIGYSLLFRIAAGAIFGLNQEVILHLLELPGSVDALKGVKMELDDCVFPCLKGVVMGSDPDEVFDGVDVAILVGAKPRGAGMERKDLLQQNAKIFVEQGKALKKTKAKVLVVGNPANTNARVVYEFAPDLDICSMMLLDQNRACAQIAHKAGVAVTDIKHLAVWGNHSSTMVPDYFNAKIKNKSVYEALDKKWLQGEFFETVQKRGAAIIKARGLSSAASAAHAAIMSVRDWILETPPDECYSAGILSDGNPYGIAPGIFFSFPLHDQEIIPGLEVDDFLQDKIKETEKELLDEWDAVSRSLK